MTDSRLVETAFPLKQVSLDSVHEKNVRHGHISTLHIWPARRPLAASRATLLATLLPDPGTSKDRRAVLGRMAGKIVEVPSASGDRMKEETRGGILHWGHESGEEGAAEVRKLRGEIQKAFGGRAPRVLDPFAGGGAIPLEAMRLGCEAVAADLNPVAWFILRCHAALSAAARRADTGAAGVRVARPRIRRGVPEGPGNHREDSVARGACPPGARRRGAGAGRLATHRW